MASWRCRRRTQSVIVAVQVFRLFGQLSDVDIVSGTLRRRIRVPIVRDFEKVASRLTTICAYALRWKVYPGFIEPEDRESLILPQRSCGAKHSLRLRSSSYDD